MNKRIFIFDDDREILAVTKIILQKHNYHVDTRSNCDDITEAVEQAKPDVVLMDLWIPEIGGEQAIKLLKANIATRHIPIILFSANVQIEDIANRSKINGFLKKPFEIPALLECIRINIPKMS